MLCLLIVFIINIKWFSKIWQQKLAFTIRCCKIRDNCAIFSDAYLNEKNSFSVGILWKLSGFIIALSYTCTQYDKKKESAYNIFIYLLSSSIRYLETAKGMNNIIVIYR